MENLFRWIAEKPLLVAAVVLMASAAVPFFVIEPDILILLVLALIAAGGGLLLLRFPSAGPVLVMAGGLFVPFGIGTGSQSSLNAAILLVAALTGLWIFDMVVVKQKVTFVRSRPMIPLIVMLLVVVISFLMGQLRWFPTGGAPFRAQIGGVAIFFLSALLVFLVANQIKTLKWIEITTKAFLIFGLAFMVLFSYIPWLFPAVGRYMEMFFSLGASGSLLFMWLMAFGFAMLLYQRNLSVKWRVFLVILLLAVLYSRFVVGRDWLSGWFPALVALAAVLWVGSPRAGVIISLLGVIFAVLNTGLLATQVTGGDNLYSLSTRLEAWTILLNIIKENPLFGVGPANYYYYTSLCNIRGYYVAFNSHNNYIDLLAQTGLLGTAAFIWFFVESGLLSFKLRVQLEEGFEKTYVIACIGGVAGTLAAAMLGDWVIPFVYNVGMDGFRSSLLSWLFLGGVIVIEQLHKGKRDTK